MIRKIVKWIIFRIVYPVCGFFSHMKRLDHNKVIMVENHDDHMTDNYQLIYNKLSEKGYDIHIHYLRMATSSWKDIIVRSIKLIMDMGDAEYIFLNESNSLFGAVAVRKGAKLIQLWHACGAFKKWGFSVADKSFGDNDVDLKRYSGHKNYFLVPVSGSRICYAYEEAFGLKHDGSVVKPIGVSRTDVFYDDSRRREAYKKLEGLKLFDKDKKVIVYLPTFRGSIAEASGPKAFDLSRLIKYKDEYNIYIKNHPFVRAPFEIPGMCRNFCMEINDELSVEDMLIVADVCITDYSSVIFEFSLMNRPMIFYAYDLDDYDGERGFYYPYEEFVPGRVAKTMEELIFAIDNVDQYDYDKLRSFRNDNMDGCDGHATTRLFEHLGICDA